MTTHKIFICHNSSHICQQFVDLTNINLSWEWRTVDKDIVSAWRIYFSKSCQLDKVLTNGHKKYFCTCPSDLATKSHLCHVNGVLPYKHYACCLKGTYKYKCLSNISYFNLTNISHASNNILKYICIFFY